MASAKKQAVSQPQFIIKMNDGTYYLTVSLWTYDPNAQADQNVSAAGQALLAKSYAAIDSKFTENFPANQVPAVQVPNNQPITYAAMAT
jgi:hypothetical protein